MRGRYTIDWMTVRTLSLRIEFSRIARMIGIGK